MLSLSELKHHVKSKGRVSLLELGAMTQEDSETIQCLMYHLIKKGDVQECRLTPHCGTKCLQCAPNKTIIYHWKGA